MDITLERILSLLPKTQDGKFKRGSKANFARSIGYDSGDIVSMWINGTSKSYVGKLHEISAKYHVSVEWLKGETDEKNPDLQKEAGTNEKDKRLIDWFHSLPPETRKAILTLGGGPEDLVD